MAEIGGAVRALGDWAAASPFDRAPAQVRHALRGAVANLLAVTVGGSTLVEVRRLRETWAPSGGAATLIGSPHRVCTEAATWLNAVAAVATERDEGNRHGKGHPAAQTVPAVLALAEERDVSGPLLWNALYVAYEVAARVGRATTFAPEVHTHGPLGAVGAAAGCALLLGADAEGIARAIDTGAAMAPATSWSSVLRGSAVRDQWVGQGALAGLAAARSVVAGPTVPAGGLDGMLSGSLGVVDPTLLVDGLGRESLIASSYLKQHSSCAYTHGPADAAMHVRARMLSDGAGPDDIVAVRVEGVASAAALSSRSWSSRHGAYFSVPFTVASALRYGDVSVERSAVPADPELLRLASLVSVVDATADLRPATPTSRPARVTVHLADGAAHTASVRHPLGDAVDTPFSPEHVEALLAEALQPAGLDTSAVHTAVDAFDDPNPGALTRALHALAPHFEGALT